jgi:N-acetylmuramoyl-L-alanine amidase
MEPEPEPRRGAGTLRAVGLALLMVLAASAAPAQNRARAPADFPVATDARLAGDAKHTRFVVDISQKIDIRAFALADPYRVVVDLPQVNFQFPPKTGDSGRGLIKTFRFGLVMVGGSRIVLDTTGPVRVEKAFVLDPVDGAPARLVIDLVAVDRATFLRAAAIDNRLPRETTTKPVLRDTQSGDPRPIVVLDPGHGGIDHGTRAGGTGVVEKTLVLDFALMLRDKLEKTGKYRVAMTRTDDTFVPLAERVQFARARQAQLFISIHCDALARGDGDAEGATIYTLSEKASDAEAGRLAENENRADVIAGVDLSREPDDIADILIDLAQRETKTFSSQFARQLISELKPAARLHKNPLKSAGFRVLKAPDVPSVLVELGYVSSRQDLKQLVSDSWRSRAGDAIVQAVNTFFTTRVAGAPGR